MLQGTPKGNAPPLPTLLIVTRHTDLARQLSDQWPLAMGTDTECLLSHNLADAVAAATSHPCELILLNLPLPDSTGMEPLQRLKLAAPESAIIVMDEVMDLNRAVESSRLGAQDYLTTDRINPEMLYCAAGVAMESHRREIELVQSESKFRNIIESLEEAYYEVDLTGRYTYVNDTLCRHLQRTRQELIGRQSLDFSPPETAERLRQTFIEVYSTGRSGKLIDDDIIRRDGSILHVELSIFLIHDESGEPIGFSGISRDVTDKKEARIELLASENKYRNILESIEDGYFELDLKGNFLFFNDALVNQFGYTREELLQLRYHDYMDETNAEKLKAAYNTIYHTGNGNGLLQYEVIRKNGRRAHMESAVSLMHDAVGRPMGFRGIARDITFRKRAEHELARAKGQAEAATRAKSNFLSNMSHEIRTPMNGIIGMYDLLLDTDLTAEQIDFVKTGQRSADSMLSVINDILDFSKIESGRMDVAWDAFDLRAMIEETLAVPAMQAREKGLSFTCHIDKAVSERLVGDPGRLRQIIMNLANNAIKFTSQGEIVFTLSREATTGQTETLHFSVRDTGIGIRPKDQERLFQSFQQVDATTTRKYGGTGLGLAISKRLAELMGGRIGVESNPGQGTTFWFTVVFRKAEIIPVKEEGATPPKSEQRQSATPETASTPIRVLLAEDNLINQKLAMHLIENFGYNGHAVTNGREAVAALCEEDFDLVLMDIQMPEMDGFEAARIIRDSASPVRDHAIPIIALTAHAMKGDREKCLNAGMDDYVSKPVQAQTLRKAIERQLPGRVKVSAAEPQNQTVSGQV